MIEDRRRRILGNWLVLGVFMLIIQVLLGGITRLTGSGLSITEWDPIMGVWPPTTETDWNQAFSAYKEIAQFKYLNQHFSLTDFKFIFFWEWFHRLWARFMGLVFIVPFIYFLIKGYFKRDMAKSLGILFILGACQGLIGWLMVKTGLNQENLYVSHFALSVHFMSAMVLTCYVYWFGLTIKTQKEPVSAPPHYKKYYLYLIILLCVQLIYGCFMAGLKAASVAPTWPTINGSWIPEQLFETGFLQSILHDAIGIQFTHRLLAYLLLLLTLFVTWRVKALPGKRVFNRSRYTPVVLIFIQIGLGIGSLWLSTGSVRGQFGNFEWIALLHQLNAMLFLLSVIRLVYLTKNSALA